MDQPKPASPLLAPAATFRARGLAFARAVLYLVIAFVAALAVSAILKVASGRTLQELLQAGPFHALLAHGGLFVALVLIPTTVSLLLWKEPAAASGWSARHGGRFVLLGLTVGAGLMVALVMTLGALGHWSGRFTPLSGGQLVALLLPALLLWTVQAAHEEGLHRGYAFVQLSRSVSFWPAAIILGGWFAAGHVGQPGATPLSLTVAGLFALVLAWSLLRTGSLWFALGVHASWNFTQSTIFGLANSGGESGPSLLRSSLRGPDLLTGGQAGPEGSVLALAAILGLVVIILFALPQGSRSTIPVTFEH